MRLSLQSVHCGLSQISLCPWLPEAEGGGDLSLQNTYLIPDFILQKESGVLKGSPRILTLLTLPLARYSG